MDGHCLEQLTIILNVDEVQECGATRDSLVGPSATRAEVTGGEKDKGVAAVTCCTALAPTSVPSSGAGGPVALVARSTAHTAALPPGYAARTVTHRVASATNVNTVYLSITSEPGQQSPRLSWSTARLLGQLGVAWGERVTTLVLQFHPYGRPVMQACMLALQYFTYNVGCALVHAECACSRWWTTNLFPLPYNHPSGFPHALHHGCHGAQRPSICVH